MIYYIMGTPGLEVPKIHLLIKSRISISSRELFFLLFASRRHVTADLEQFSTQTSVTTAKNWSKFVSTELRSFLTYNVTYPAFSG